MLRLRHYLGCLTSGMHVYFCVCRQRRLRLLRPAAKHWAGCAQGRGLAVHAKPVHTRLDRHRPLQLGQGLWYCVQRWPYSLRNVRLAGCRFAREGLACTFEPAGAEAVSCTVGRTELATAPAIL